MTTKEIKNTLKAQIKLYAERNGLDIVANIEGTYDAYTINDEYSLYYTSWGDNDRGRINYIGIQAGYVYHYFQKAFDTFMYLGGGHDSSYTSKESDIHR